MDAAGGGWEKAGIPIEFRRDAASEGTEDYWWALQDLNLGPMDYESTALTAELRARFG